MTTVIESFAHGLSFAIRFDNYFTGAPIADELFVRLRGSLARPVRASVGGFRQEDGSYRFINLQTGLHEVMWSPPLTTRTTSWVSWQPPLIVESPTPTPASLIRVPLWPTPSAEVAPSTNAVRGKLVGADVAARRVVLEAIGVPNTNRFTLSDENGEFVFLIPQTAPLTGEGLLPLTAAVTGAVVSGGRVGGAPFVGSQFSIIPSRQNRVVLTLA